MLLTCRLFYELANGYAVTAVVYAFDKKRFELVPGYVHLFGFWAFDLCWGVTSAPVDEADRWRTSSVRMRSIVDGRSRNVAKRTRIIVGVRLRDIVRKTKRIIRRTRSFD